MTKDDDRIEHVAGVGQERRGPMTPHEQALMAIFDLRELDRWFKELREAWDDYVIAHLELEMIT